MVASSHGECFEGVESRCTLRACILAAARFVAAGCARTLRLAVCGCCGFRLLPVAGFLDAASLGQGSANPPKPRSATPPEPRSANPPKLLSVDPPESCSAPRSYWFSPYSWLSMRVSFFTVESCVSIDCLPPCPVAVRNASVTNFQVWGIWGALKTAREVFMKCRSVLDFMLLLLAASTAPAP